MIYDTFKCPTHGYSYVSMPRGGDTLNRQDIEPTQWICKCPLRFCFSGLKAPVIIDTALRLSLDIAEDSHD